LGWEYYRNLTSGDFKAAFNFDRLFIQHRFSTNWWSFDLYFCGIARGTEAGAPRTDGWDTLVGKLDTWLEPYNRFHRSRYRKAVARALGDRAFGWQRKILSRLDYWLGRLDYWLE
jgi:hypothetical protein